MISYATDHNNLSDNMTNLYVVTAYRENTQKHKTLQVKTH